MRKDIGQERLWTQAQLLMLIANFDGTILDANPAWKAILGWPSDAIIGKNVFELMHPADVEASRGRAANLLAGKQIPKFENRYLAADGEYRHIDWTAVSDGEYIHALGRDITLEKQHGDALTSAENAMRQAQKMEAIGQLTGGVAHDFNNLLTVIRGSVDLLRRPDLSEDRRNRYIDAIGDTADRAAKLTSQLLAFARRQALTPVILNLGEGVIEIASMVRALNGSRIEMHVNVPDDPIFVQVDSTQLHTAIINMAVNARDAMGGEGELTISAGTTSAIPAVRGHAAVEGDFATLTIMDNGRGIDENDLAHIFEPFFTTKQVGEGTGLGLSQVIGFAKQSGGDVDVASRVGEGARFTLYLPRVFPQQGDVSPDDPVFEKAGGEGVCVLIVEDNEDVGHFARDALTELGYDSILAYGGDAALAELRKQPNRIDVVFSDVVMPGMSGIELGNRVRSEFPDIVVILASGYSDILAQNSDHGFELLHKPYSIEQLAGILNKAVHGQQPLTD